MALAGMPSFNRLSLIFTAHHNFKKKFTHLIVECVKVVYLIYQLTTNTNTMTTQQVLDTMLKNETLLMDYFKKVNVPTDRLQKVEVFNGRNCKCSALTLRCNNEQEFNSYKSAFYYANQKGGDYFTYSNKDLTITIKDNWN